MLKQNMVHNYTLHLHVVFGLNISNGHSPANLSNSSTRQNDHFGNRSDSIHSPNIRQPFSPDSIHSPDIRQPFCLDSPDSERQVWRLLNEFSEFGEFGEFSECRLDRFIHIKYVICA